MSSIEKRSIIGGLGFTAPADDAELLATPLFFVMTQSSGPYLYLLFVELPV